MDFQNLVSLVEWATILVTFIMMGSGFPSCLNMYRQRSTVNVPYMLFLITTLVSVLSFQYGILISNKTLVLINTVSILVWGIYVGVFILVSKSKTQPLMKLLAVIILYLAHLYYLNSQNSSQVIPTLGKYLIVWCTILCILPIGEIVTMVQEKSAECCDLSLLIGGTLSASVWLLYGFLVNDFNIYFPSIPALFVNATKFGLICLYGRAAKQVQVSPSFKNQDKLGDAVNKIKGGEALRKRN